MYCCRVSRNRWAAVLILGSLAPTVVAAPPEDDTQAKQRLELMRAAVRDLVPESAELKAKDALAVVPDPLLRYSEPTRDIKTTSGCLDAGVWRLGTEGRPLALVTVEIYLADGGSRVLSYEFLSLTDKKFALKHKTEAVRWDATASGLELKDLTDGPKPAATPAARLTQMRQLARRFGAKEDYNKETVECRLIAQPIDRYQSEKEKIADGAIFVLANGTNPEIGIVLETDGRTWRYGILRLSATRVTVTLDDKEVAAYEPHKTGASHDGPYSSGSYKIGATK
jgi:hypothetical protein